MAKYIDNNGFAHFLGKLKTLLDKKVDIVSGKGLSTNDYTTEEKTKLAGIDAGANAYTLPTAGADTKGGVKIGSGLTMTGEVLSADVQDIPAASASQAGMMSAADYTKLAALPTNATLDSTYAKKTDITSMYKHKGSVASTSALPSTGNTAGDVYNVTATGMNYVWTGEDWDALGEIFSIDAMTTTEIDTAFTNAGLAAAS